MPLQNRVQPDGEIEAHRERGTLMGNRGGVFHTAERTLRPRHWHSRQWICCLLAFKGRHRQMMQPDRYTELFFLDEVTALAAGHRPCFECRRAAAVAFATAWNRGRGLDGRAAAADMDRVLHQERLDRHGRKRTCTREVDGLPAETMIRLDGAAWRICGNRLQMWTPAGYGELRSRPRQGPVEVLTPPSIVAVLGTGYAPVLHNSAASRR